jgi:hypothetical protein
LKEHPRVPPESSLPNVVKDSIFATTQLGFRYRWVDKYCIDQSDATAQKEYINNMDLVYRGAELTIIAAAGEDERHGLPGIGVKRIRQRTIKIGKFTVRGIPKHTSAIFRRFHLGIKSLDVSRGTPKSPTIVFL